MMVFLSIPRPTGLPPIQCLGPYSLLNTALLLRHQR